MGNKCEKVSQKVSSKKELTEKDFGFLINQTGLQQVEIKQIFEQFNTNNSNQLLDKNEFIRLYHQLNPKAPELIGKISEYVFRAFDTNNNGSINFGEFLIGYAMTAHGDPAEKLDYAFDVYDLDKNRYIDLAELKTVLKGMLEMLNLNDVFELNVLAYGFMKNLDSSHDQKISKDEFIKGLLSNPKATALMDPFKK